MRKNLENLLSQIPLKSNDSLHDLIDLISREASAWIHGLEFLNDDDVLLQLFNIIFTNQHRLASISSSDLLFSILSRHEISISFLFQIDIHKLFILVDDVNHNQDLASSIVSLILSLYYQFSLKQGTNKVMGYLESTRTSLFSQELVFLFNRSSPHVSPSTSLSFNSELESSNETLQLKQKIILEFISEILKTTSLEFIFYKSDLNCIVDIFIREMVNGCENEDLEFLFLNTANVVLNSKAYKQDKHKEKEFIEVIESCTCRR